MMYGYDGSSEMWIYKTLLFVLGSFVFSAIFWLTHKWVEHNTTKKK